MSSGPGLKLVSYNVAGSHLEDAPFVARFGAIAAVVRELNPDVLCLQDVPDTAVVRRLTGYLMAQQRRALFSACAEVPGRRGYLAIVHPGTRRVAQRSEPAGASRAIAVTLAASGLTVVNVSQGAVASGGGLLMGEGPVVVAGWERTEAGSTEQGLSAADGFLIRGARVDGSGEAGLEPVDGYRGSVHPALWATLTFD